MYIIEMDIGDLEFQKVHNFLIMFSIGLFWAALVQAGEPHNNVNIIESFSTNVCFKKTRTNCSTVRPRDTQPQAAGTLRVHIFQ